MALQTVHGTLINHPRPLRAIITATLVNLDDDPIIGYVEDFAPSGGEYITTVQTYPDEDGNWSLQLAANDDIDTPFGTSLWKVNQNGALAYIFVPASGGPFWVHDILTDPPNGGAVTANYAVVSVDGRTGIVTLADLYASVVHTHPAPTGGGAVTSVNGLTGVVVLNAAAVGADPSGTATTAVANHSTDTTNVHGITDTADLALRSEVLEKPAWLFDVTDYGASGNARIATDGAITSGDATLTCASGPFTLQDVNKSIMIKGAAITGVTSLIATIASFTSATSVELSINANTTVTGAQVIWGTDDTNAIQNAVDAAEAYLVSHSYAQVYFPPSAYVVAGALNNTKSGNGQIVFGVYPTTSNKKILEFRGETDGAAAVRHWQQTVPQFAGSCLISFGVFSSTSAQITSLNADGNPGVISGPNEGSGYGVSGVYSNVMPVLKNLTILNSHSSFGLSYGAATFWGCANAYIENFGYGTVGTVASPSTDYTSPGVFATGLSVGLLLPAPGNNDHTIARNISCGGGYTYALFLTEHTVMDRFMALYCWSAIVAVGNYAGSVGSVHGMKVLTASIEACTHELYIMGAGSGGVGPIIDIDQLSTESSTPNIAGNTTGALNASLGDVKFTGLFTESGVSVQAPTGIRLSNGSVPRAIKRKTGTFTCSPIDRTLICDTTSGGFTGSLPLADFNPVEYVFKNVGTNTLTVGTTSSQLIYTTSGTGATTATVATGNILRVQALYNGSTWGWYAL